MNPDMKLVVMLREPVARALVEPSVHARPGFETEADFLAAVTLEEERKAAGWHHIWHYTSQSRYADQVAALLEAFPREQVGVFFFDDLERDYEGTLARVLDFFGVHGARGRRGHPARQHLRSAAFAAAHAVLGWAVGNELVRTFVKERTSYRFRERIRRTLLRQDVLPADARAQLEPLFADDLARLRAMLGRTDGPVWLTSGGTT